MAVHARATRGGHTAIAAHGAFVHVAEHAFTP